jgi:DNA-directed RNA polymerase specialized sigma24 family protein
MKTDLKLTDEDFNSFLDWLSPDRDEAGKEYEQTRLGLMRYFRVRGCVECETLADETINRVISKLHTYDLTKDIPKSAIFHSFAKNIFLEFLKKLKNDELWKQKNQMYFTTLSVSNDDEESNDIQCLEKCLSELDSDDRSLIIDYYSEEKGAKIEIRKKLAAEYNINRNALHLRVFRIRSGLKDCIEKCLAKKNM